MIHALLALITCGILFALGLPWPAMFWSGAFYLGREISQSEYRYIQSHGGKRDKCPWYCGFYPSSWTAKSVIDCLFPLVICLLAAIAAIIWR